MTTDIAELTELNLRFIEAFRQGRWDLLKPLLADDFAHLDGATGAVWSMDKYVADVEVGQPKIEIDQVRIHVAGDVAAVSARSAPWPGRFNRYVDTYQRRDNRWLCVYACVWPLHPTDKE